MKTSSSQPKDIPRKDSAWCTLKPSLPSALPTNFTTNAARCNWRRRVKPGIASLLTGHGNDSNWQLRLHRAWLLSNTQRQLTASRMAIARRTVFLCTVEPPRLKLRLLGTESAVKRSQVGMVHPLFFDCAGGVCLTGRLYVLEGSEKCARMLDSLF
jgi:hypothetical protein